MFCVHYSSELLNALHLRIQYMYVLVYKLGFVCRTKSSFGAETVFLTYIITVMLDLVFVKIMIIFSNESDMFYS